MCPYLWSVCLSMCPSLPEVHCTPGSKSKVTSMGQFQSMALWQVGALRRQVPFLQSADVLLSINH